MTTIIGSIERGHYVARGPNGTVAIVALGPIGRRVGGVEIGAICARLGGPQVSGAFWNKIKRGAKKAVKTTVKIAKTAADNKIIAQLYNSAKASIPPPYNIALAAVETGVRFGRAVAAGSPKARKALPVVQGLAEGRVSLRAAKRQARALGLKANTVRDAAAMIKLKKAAARGKNKGLKDVFRAAEQIESVRKQDRAIVDRVVRAPSGRKFAVVVRAA